MITDIILIVIFTLLTFPLTHLFMKKGMILDYNLTETKQKDLTKFFTYHI